MQSNGLSDSQNSSGGGVVELREDVPLKGGGAAGEAWCAGGPRLIIACFAALSAGITLALVTQIYYGDVELVPHGSVSSAAAACSRAGTDALKAGGRALDAAAAAALCLAVAAPTRTSLDASGSLVYWEYRELRTQKPTLAEWGGVPLPAEIERPPRLVAALAALHAEHGVLPWSRVLQPAIELAKGGFEVTEGPAVDINPTPSPADSVTIGPVIAAYLETLQKNTSAELSAIWSGSVPVSRSSLAGAAAGAWRVFAGGAGRDAAVRALALALDPPPTDFNDASARVVAGLQQEAATGAWPPPPSPATGLAVVDRFDTYVALVTGTSVAGGSGPLTAAGWQRDEPARPLDLAPAIMVDGYVCGTRYVVGAESSGALAQAGAALGAGGGAAAVERPRVAVRAGGALALEVGRVAPAAAALPAGLAVTATAAAPHAAVNVVQQTADALLSHADSRGGGLASRF